MRQRRAIGGTKYLYTCTQHTHTPVNVTAIKLYVLLTALRALNAIYLIGNAGIIILQRAASACVALNA